MPRECGRHQEGPGAFLRVASSSGCLVITQLPFPFPSSAWAAHVPTRGLTCLIFVQLINDVCVCACTISQVYMWQSANGTSNTYLPCSCRWNRRRRRGPGGCAKRRQRSVAGRHFLACAHDCRHPVYERLICNAFSTLRCPCGVCVCLCVCVCVCV